jgi:uncharacterized protein YodC (DUF2158 family)
MNEIAVGQLVELKSGGPTMTVAEVGDLNGKRTAWCDWFDEKHKPVRHAFPITSLKSVNE